MKKVIGYKLKMNAPDADAGTIGRIEGKEVLFKTKDEEYINSITTDSIYSLEFCKTNTEWFEIVYEEEPIWIEIGVPKKKVVITNGYAKVDDYLFTKDGLQNLLEDSRVFLRVGTLPVRSESFFMGCAEGSFVTRKEIETVIELLDKK